MLYSVSLINGILRIRLKRGDMSKDFYVANGTVIRDLQSLVKSLENMPVDTFHHHVTHQNNDFTNWIKDVLGKAELAEFIRTLKSPQDMASAINHFIKTGRLLYETIILGGGFAGMSAAIYASRKRMRYLLISEDFGGQIAVSGEIENYPGIVKTDYLKFGEIMKEQMKFNNVEFTYETVKKIEKSKDKHCRITTNKNIYETRSLIIATGARHRKLNVAGEDKYSGKGVTYCAWCDAPLFKDKVVAVIGGGDSAMEAVDVLLRVAKHIYLVNINPKLTGHEYLQERVEGQEKVTILNNAKTTEILGEKFVTGIKLVQKNGEKTLPVSGVFVEIGLVPNTEIAKGFVKLDNHGHIVVSKYCETSKKGVFSAGDCTDLHAFQYATAGGSGVAALIAAAKYLQRNK